jgi:methyltransferase family protein
VSVPDRCLGQFEAYPYPFVSTDAPVLSGPKDLYRWCVAPSFYRRDGIVPTRSLRILDVGCGTGVQTIKLAVANPGCFVHGIDPSEAAISLAEERGKFHHIANVEFTACSLEAAAPLGAFDYVNCYDVLYLMADPLAALRKLSSLLRPDGIVLVALHNEFARRECIRSQQVLKMLGIARPPWSQAAERVRQLCSLLQPHIPLRRRLTKGKRGSDRSLMCNELLVEDFGVTLDEGLALVHDAGFCFVGMSDYWSWSWDCIVNTASCDAVDFVRSLDALSMLDQLKLLDLLRPASRLYSFLCSITPRNTSFWWQAPRQELERLQILFHPVCLDRKLQMSVALASQRAGAMSLAEFIPSVSPEYKLDPISVRLLLRVLACGAISRGVCIGDVLEDSNESEPVIALLQRLERLGLLFVQ